MNKEELKTKVRGINLGKNYGYKHPLMMLLDEDAIELIADLMLKEIEEARKEELNPELLQKTKELLDEYFNTNLALDGYLMTELEKLFTEKIESMVPRFRDHGKKGNNS